MKKSKHLAELAVSSIQLARAYINRFFSQTRYYSSYEEISEPRFREQEIEFNESRMLESEKRFISAKERFYSLLRNRM